MPQAHPERRGKPSGGACSATGQPSATGTRVSRDIDADFPVGAEIGAPHMVRGVTTRLRRVPP